MTEVLLENFSGKMDKESIGLQVIKLASKVEDVKYELYTDVNRRYKEFTSHLISATELSNKVRSVSKEMGDLSSTIQNDITKQIQISTDEVQDIAVQLNRTNAIITVLRSLQMTLETLHNLTTSLENKEFLTACDQLDNIDSELQSLTLEENCEMQIVKTLKTESKIMKQSLLHELGKAWAATVHWTLPQPKEAHKLSGILKAQVRIVDAHKIEDVVRAMDRAGILKTKLMDFGRTLDQYLLGPLVRRGRLQPQLESQDGGGGLTLLGLLSQAGGAPDGQWEQAAPPGQLYASLTAIFTALHRKLLHFKVSGGVTLISLLGESLWREMSENIINHCLLHSIPTQHSQLDNYNSVVKETEEFERNMVKLGLLKEDTSPLLTYARDVNIHFANKKCQDLVVKARSLMTSDLHNMVEIKEDVPLTQLAKLHKKDSVDKEASGGVGLAEGTLRFPGCCISGWVEELVALVHRTLDEALETTPQCALQLFYTVRNILELFCDVVPTYHRRRLLQLPQLAALHHNNCLYLAHHLLVLGHQYKHRLPPPVALGGSTFVDLVLVFRNLASECFLAQMRAQRDQLLESLAGAKGFADMEDSQNCRMAERALKQVLHQLNHLKSVWQGVLPLPVFVKALSTLINTAIQEVIYRVLALEDISADHAVNLYSALKTLVDKAPELLEIENSREPVPIQVHVPNWMKFKELLITLDASLQDIEDRWADGKGPLAYCFSGGEVRTLVRALFQNTDRRAAVITKLINSST